MKRKSVSSKTKRQIFYFWKKSVPSQTLFSLFWIRGTLFHTLFRIFRLLFSFFFFLFFFFFSVFRKEGSGWEKGLKLKRNKSLRPNFPSGRSPLNVVFWFCGGIDRRERRKKKRRISYPGEKEREYIFKTTSTKIFSSNFL